MADKPIQWKDGGEVEIDAGFDRDGKPYAEIVSHDKGTLAPPRSVQATISISAYDIAQLLGIVFIVHDLAKTSPFFENGCIYCGGREWRPEHEIHDPACLWRRAKDIEESGVLNGR